MPNYLDSLIAHCGVGLHVDVYGERDEHGAIQEIILTEPSKTERKLLGVIIGDMRVSDEVQDEHGTHLRENIEDILDIRVPRIQSWGVFDPKTESRVSIPRHAGEVFTVLEVLSLTETWAELRLSRKHVTGIRRGASERN